MRLEDFERESQKIRAVTEQVDEPVLGLELRRREDGTEFCINCVMWTIYVKFPGRDEWFDFAVIKKRASLGVMQSELLTTLPNHKLLELEKMLKVRKGGAK